MGKAAGKNRVMIYHICRFKDRYEIRDHSDRFKKGPLMFTKSFVGSGQDNESISYYQQKLALRTRPNYHMLRGVFDDLIEIAANRSLCYRGYLIDESYQPATIKTISQWLGLDTKTTERALKILTDVRLIEYVVMPKFDPKVDAVSEISGGRRQRPAKAGKRRQPFNNKRKSVSGNRQRLKRNNNRQEPNVKPKPKRKRKISQTAGQSPAGKQGPKPKHKPTESESEQGQTQASPAAPVHSVTSFERTSKLTESHATSFATAIYDALKVPAVMGTTKGEREYQSFAAAWNRAQKAGLGLPLLQKLWDASVKSAERIGNKRRRGHWKKSPEATWMYEFNQRLKAYQAGKVEIADGFRRH